MGLQGQREEMPDKKTIEAAHKDEAEGKSSSTQAGEFVRAEIDKVRHGEHGVRSTKQAIAIGLSEARRAGVNLKAPKKGKYPDRVITQAERDRLQGQEEPSPKPDRKKSESVTASLKKESSAPVSHDEISKQSKSAASHRTALERSESALKAAQTRSPEQRSQSAYKAAQTRKANSKG
jgi:hypothetical protein